MVRTPKGADLPDEYTVVFGSMKLPDRHGWDFKEGAMVLHGFKHSEFLDLKPHEWLQQPIPDWFYKTNLHYYQDNEVLAIFATLYVTG